MPPVSIIALGLLSLLLVLLKTVFSEVLVYSACRINKLLLAGVEGVAGRADIKSVVASRGLCTNFVTTRAGEDSFSVLWMYILLHLLFLHAENRRILLVILHVVKEPAV